MNDELYYIEKNKNQILLTVTVSTHGVAVSEIKLVIDSQNLVKGNSTDGSGNVYKAPIGFAENLNYGLVVVETDVFLNKVPKTEWKSCFEELMIKYYFEGGKSEQKALELKKEEKHVDDTGSTIVAKKYINLIFD